MGNKVNVTATSTHYGAHGLVKTGDEYEIDEALAAQLKASGLVDYDGPAAPKKKGENILHASDKPKEKEETKKMLEKMELKPGELPTAKKAK